MQDFIDKERKKKIPKQHRPSASHRLQHHVTLHSTRTAQTSASPGYRRHNAAPPSGTITTQQDSAANHEGLTHSPRLSPPRLSAHARHTTRALLTVPSGREGRLRGRHSGGNNPPFLIQWNHHTATRRDGRGDEGRVVEGFVDVEARRTLLLSIVFPSRRLKMEKKCKWLSLSVSYRVFI